MIMKYHGCLFLKYSCILYSTGFFSMFKNQHINGKKLIHEGHSYFLGCERALRVLGTVQMDSKAQPLSEKL